MNKSKKSIIINSAQYDNKTDFVFPLAQTIKITNFFQLVYCSIPNTNYLINNYNNNLIITFNDSTIKNIILVNKNYDVDSLATEIKNAINYSSFDMIFDKNMIKFQLSASQSFNVSGSMCDILGITQNQLFNNSNVYTTNSINFTSPQILYISINEIQNPNVICNTSKSTTFFIHNSAMKNSIMAYYSYDYDNIVYVDYPIDLNYIHVKILDESFNLYDNNNIPVQMILNFY